MPELIHTCYRIGDIDRSLAFYAALGFEELRRMDLPDGAINVFVGLPDDGPRLELTKNPGVEDYEIGTGYGHIAITSEDLDGTLGALAEQGIEPEKPPYTVSEGGSRLCFVRDPDGYRIELIQESGLLIGRWLDLHGTANARVLVDGALLRSDNLQDLSEQDVSRLVEEEGLTDVVDLRTGAELEREGPGPLTAEERVRIEHRSLYPETDTDADLLAVWGTGGADLPDDTPTVRAYVGYLERRPDSLVGALRDIAHAEGAVPVHCAAGKDRTGVVVMLALVLAGVDHGDVIADYLRSAERIDGIVERLASTETYRAQIRVEDPRAHAPREGTLDRVLELLEERFGGAEAYVREHGMTDDELERLRGKLAAVRTG